MKFYFCILVCENEARTIVGVDTACVPIEIECPSQNSVRVIAASIEPRVSRVNEVGIVAVKSQSQKEENRVNLYNL